MSDAGKARYDDPKCRPIKETDEKPQSRSHKKKKCNEKSDCIESKWPKAE
jgi:hypothetical protein